MGATLSATDPVTILAIFNTYKVDPKLYTVIFGESILNDAIAIVIFQTAQRYGTGGDKSATLTITSLFEAIGIFLLVFFGSLLVGVVVGIGTALGLKYTLVRKFPKIESCLIVLIAYASYYFANGAYMSGWSSPVEAVEGSRADNLAGIVSLLFCGITLKHYAYYNMSRRTQLTTKYIFQVTAQLSENFIFIYLGLTLFTETTLYFKPLFILITVIGICAARWAAVFPLSKAINWFIRYRARRRGRDAADELPHSYQVMLFWAGLRGAVGVALAASLKAGQNVPTLQATILVVVVLTVIIFGGTTARMLEIMGIKTGVVEEIDSDDEFDIETATNGTYYKSSGAVGHQPQRGNGTTAHDRHKGRAGRGSKINLESYSSGSNSASPPIRPTSATSRNNSIASQRERDAVITKHALLGQEDHALSDEEDMYSDSDLPPAARTRSPKQKTSPPPRGSSRAQPESGRDTPSGEPHLSASDAISQFFTGTSDEHAAWFKQLDDGFIKPKLLLDQNRKGGGSGSNV